MGNQGSVGISRYVENFQTDNIAASAADGVAWLVLGDGGDTNFVRAFTAARGVHVAGATAATDNNMIEFCGDQLEFYGQQGHVAIELLVQLDVITTAAFNFGFNDDVLDASDTLPVELATTTFTANAATFVGFVYDVDATNDQLHAFWVNGGTATTTAIADLRFKGIAPTAAQYLWMRVELQDRGSGNGVRATLAATDHLGKSAIKTYNTTVARDTALCFYFGYENRGAVIHNVRLKLPVKEHGQS